MRKFDPPLTKTQNSHEGLFQTIREIGKNVLEQHASDVDSQARFPFEAMQALRDEHLLSAFIPKEYGGGASSIVDLVTCTQLLAQHCAATAMIWAMHQIQVACIVRHCQSSSFFHDYLRSLVEHQWLIASVTSEVGIGGDIRTSKAAVEKEGTSCILCKEAPTISYGEFADSFLITARPHIDANQNDQILALAQRAEVVLEKTGEWNALGLRGTCSSSFSLSARFSPQQILPVPFADIVDRTMVPFAHLLWSACWLGIAMDALARARSFTQARTRQKQQISPALDTRLADATNLLQLMRTHIYQIAYEYERMVLEEQEDPGTLSSIAFALTMNNLKISSSQLVTQIVGQALAICGMVGYKEDTPYSVARHLRDAYSAGIMISNHRLYETNASLLLVFKDH